LSSDDQMGGGDHLRVARSEPRRVVAAVGLGVAGNDTGDELGGCRSSGEVGLVAAVVLEARGQLLRGLRGAARSVDSVAWPLDGRSYVGDELRRRRVRMSLG
jgi:hypothetical protein